MGPCRLAKAEIEVNNVDLMAKDAYYQGFVLLQSLFGLVLSIVMMIYVPWWPKTARKRPKTDEKRPKTARNGSKRASGPWRRRCGRVRRVGRAIGTTGKRRSRRAATLSMDFGEISKGFGPFSSFSKALELAYGLKTP